MKKLIPAVVLSSLFVLASCDPETGRLALSGRAQVNDGTSNPQSYDITIGLFPAGIAFEADGVVIYGVDPDLRSVAPLVSVKASVSGNYSIEFPEDLSSVSQMAAWADLNDDGVYQMTEPGLLPTKTVGETDVVVTGWSVVGDLLSALDFEGSTYDLDAIGAGGFDFSFYLE